MLTKVAAGAYTIRGISLGGVYTSLQVPELRLMFDVGLAPRSFAGSDYLFLSHAHADHIGALTTWLGFRALSGKTSPPRVFMPAEIVAEVEAALIHMTTLQRYDLSVDAVPMMPGDEHPLHADLSVRAFRTHHPVPSLGYQLLRRKKKLKAEFRDLPGPEIGQRRQAGEDLFDEVSSLELAYATDTLAEVLDRTPSLLESRVLILECTFLDDRKSRADSRAGCHIHLDDLLERADRFHNEKLVLMHFSQLYQPAEVHEILKKRCPPTMYDRLVTFAPKRGPWPG